MVNWDGWQKWSQPIPRHYPELNFPENVHEWRTSVRKTGF